MVISKANKRAAKLAVTNIAPCEEYGMTSIGVAPTSIENCKRNRARATGFAGRTAIFKCGFC